MCGRKRNRRRRRLNGFRRMGNSLINLSFFFGKRRVGSSRKSLSWRISLSAFCISYAPRAGGNPILRKRKELNSTYFKPVLPSPPYTHWDAMAASFLKVPSYCGRWRKMKFAKYVELWTTKIFLRDLVASADKFDNFLLPISRQIYSFSPAADRRGKKREEMHLRYDKWLCCGERTSWTWREEKRGGEKKGGGTK